MPRTTAPSTNPRIVSGYAPYSKHPLLDPQPKGSATTTEGRRQLLLDDPHARDVQPEQVTCTRCAKTVRLQKGKAYHLAHWLDHRWRCEKAVAVNPPPRAKSRTLPERKALLESDPDVRHVEPGRVICGKCEKEIKFRKGRPYGLSSWTQHKNTCKLIATSSSNSTSSAASPSPTPTQKHTELTSDPLIATFEPHRVKCALCLTWIEMSLQTETDIHVWRRHRKSCLAENLADDKLEGRARFFRPRHRQDAAPGADAEPHSRGSPAPDDNPQRSPAPHSPLDQCPQNAPATAPQAHSITKKSNIADLIHSPLARSASPPPLSFSGATSVDTSAACTPATSPRRTLTLPGIRHLPFPDYTPLSLSRFALDHPVTPGASALGLRLFPPPLMFEKTPPPDREAHLPPYPERTHLSLPLPSRYWRFESID